MEIEKYFVKILWFIVQLYKELWFYQYFSLFWGYSLGREVLEIYKRFKLSKVYLWWEFRLCYKIFKRVIFFLQYLPPSFMNVLLEKICSLSGQLLGSLSLIFLPNCCLVAQFFNELWFFQYLSPIWRLSMENGVLKRYTAIKLPKIDLWSKFQVSISNRSRVVVK